MRWFFVILCSFPLCCQGLIHEKVVICGVCRDVGERLPYSIQIMEQIGELFEDYRIVVYENNSQDNTVSILKKWVFNNSKVAVKTEILDDAALFREIINRTEDGRFFRPELISRARNIVLESALSDEYQEYTYLIWMDMDFRIPPSYDGIIETFNADTEWDAVFAYGVDPRGIYWDWYAFRDAISPIGSELLGNQWWYLPKEFELNSSSEWYPVYSAFGGCGIYKKSSIAGCHYSALVTEDLEFVARDIIEKEKEHPHIQLYFDLLHQKSSIIPLNSDFSDIKDPNVGFVLSGQNPLVWRMSSFVYRYPSTCEHVTFHASMIRRGHGRLFINPRLIFNYGG